MSKRLDPKGGGSLEKPTAANNRFDEVPVLKISHKRIMSHDKRAGIK
jgi:hypothetical protein